MGEGLKDYYTADLLSAHQNPDGGNEMLLQAVKELPSASKELLAEAWAHPVDTAISVGKTVGTGVAMGAALGYLIPGRGTVAALVGTAFTIPAVINTYRHFNSAYQAAQNSDADINAIAHSFAKDALTESGNFVLGTAGGLAGSELGRSLAMSRTPIGDFGQSAQRMVLKAETKTYDAVQGFFSKPAIADLSPGRFDIPEITMAQRSSTLSTMDGVKLPEIPRLNAAAKMPKSADGKELEMVYGSLHGHSVYSDGMGKPTEIFAKAKEEGMQFTAITDHNHLAARGGVKPGDPRYPGHQENTTVAESPEHYTETIWAAKNATKPGEFVGLSGVEVGTIGKVGSSSKAGVNHINILEVPDFYETVRQPRNSLFFDKPNVVKIADGDYKALVDHLDGIKDSTGGRPVIQLNHPRWGADESPNLEAKLRGRDYGQKSFKSQKEWRERFGKYASQIEILNGDALKPGSSAIESSHIHADDFAGYLDKGLRLSPTFGRDFHFGDPGGTKAATGVLVENLDKPSIMNALRERRTIATTDKELLTGRMTANGKNMGSILDQTRNHDLNVEMQIGGKVTPDAEYKVHLWGDPKIGDKKLADVIQTIEMSGKDLAAAGGKVKFDEVQHIIGAKGAYYVEVERFAKGVRAPERMWTAPVWVEPATSDIRSLMSFNALLGIGAASTNR